MFCKRAKIREMTTKYIHIYVADLVYYLMTLQTVYILQTIRPDPFLAAASLHAIKVKCCLHICCISVKKLI